MDTAERKVFMFTGALSIPRWQAQQLTIEAGGICGSSVSSMTDYLVVGEKPGSKLTKAENLGIKTLTEDEFRAILDSGKDEDGENWNNVQCAVTIEDFLSALNKLSRMKSYWEPSILKTLLEEYPEIEIMDPSTCPFCESEIPYSVYGKGTYSIQAGTYYCFNCGNYSNITTHSCCWELTDFPGTTLEPLVTFCKICHEMQFTAEREYKEYQSAVRSRNYWASVERLAAEAEDKRIAERILPFLEIKHTCKDWEVLDIPLENGLYVKCKVCGNVKFVDSDDLVDSVRPDVEVNKPAVESVGTVETEVIRTTDIVQPTIPKSDTQVTGNTFTEPTGADCQISACDFQATVTVDSITKVC